MWCDSTIVLKLHEIRTYSIMYYNQRTALKQLAIRLSFTDESKLNLSDNNHHSYLFFCHLETRNCSFRREGVLENWKICMKFSYNHFTELTVEFNCSIGVAERVLCYAPVTSKVSLTNSPDIELHNYFVRIIDQNRLELSPWNVALKIFACEFEIEKDICKRIVKSWKWWWRGRPSNAINSAAESRKLTTGGWRTRDALVCREKFSFRR